MNPKVIQYAREACDRECPCEQSARCNVRWILEHEDLPDEKVVEHLLEEGIQTIRAANQAVCLAALFQEEDSVALPAFLNTSELLDNAEAEMFRAIGMKQILEIVRRAQQVKKN